MHFSQSMMELFKKRQSVRRFADKPIEREILLQCAEAARLAPSAENSQPSRFIIVDDPETKTNLAKHAFTGVFAATRWAEKAPVLVVQLAKLDVLANRIGKQITGLNYYLIDSGIAGEHFVLQAHALDLGTCWIGWFSAKGVKKALKLPAKYRPVAMFAVGYPDSDNIRTKKRHDLEEIAWFNEVQ